ncbi:MAG TPA: chromosome segregation protein SMC [Nevskiaceae bacterium]|nr:chromosome segregation protein SMC [Nevskiaceae bacterium]
MRLTALKLAGFKSFVDPTTLPLPTNLTGVVGPNGSGKSNLIDAVRWVLGESSAKTLRGADSEDVIFNGAKSRKPGGRAAVELHFDNSDQKLQGAWGRYTDIAVRREIVRGEASQYYINGQKCLKRDVVDLFLGTGLGGRNQYAILEQGTIAQLVEAKPEELRRWLEEAAGISRYKDRRRETESRIKQTRDNLARLGDLQGELTKRLETLTRQAADAEKYNQSKQEERRLRAELLLLRQRAVERELASRQQAVAAIEVELARVRAAVGVAAATRQAADETRNAANEAFNAVQREVYAAQAAVAGEEQGLAHARELQALHARELQGTEGQLAQLVQRVAQEATRVAALTRQLEESQARASDCEGHQGELGAALREAEAGLITVRDQWTNFQRRSQAPRLDAERERMRVQGLEKAGAGLEQRRTRLLDERATLDGAPLQASLFKADEELARLQQDIEAAQAQLASQDAELEHLREQRTMGETALHDVRHALEVLRGRRASLETLQQAALHGDDKRLAQWLAQQGWQARPRLVDVLRVKPGWEAAAEQVLAGLLQAPVLDGWETVSLPVLGPSSGIAALSGATQVDAGPAGTLATQVSGPTVIREWLASVRTVEDESQLGAVAAELAVGESVIDRSGVWRGRGWMRYPRTDAADSGVIARGQLLRDIEIQHGEQAARLQSLEVTQQTLHQRVQALEVERRTALAHADQARARHGRCLADRQAQAVRLDQTQRRLAAVNGELQALEAEQQDTAATLAAGRGTLARLEEQLRALQAEGDGLSTMLEAARNTERQARRVHDEGVQAANAAQVKAAGQSSALEAARVALSELQVRHTEAAQAIVELRTRSAVLEQPVDAHAAQLQSVRAVLEQANGRLREARERISAAETAGQAAQHELQAAENRRDQVTEALQQARVAVEGERSRVETFATQLGEMNQDVAALAEALPAQADMETWEVQLAKVGRRIERLGAINLAAIPELEETRGRATYLDGQRSDLEQALATLEQAMTQLDHETRDLFRTTYERIDLRFRECCPRLFGGGEAALERTDDDWLVCGVRVMVRPPGKRNTAIQSLSGGEKALAALALLFALFELNPAPFCLLDEVEAPLDEANVRRFSALVQDMARNVQFIIITHNKVTMELAEHLHGVTMQEPGVSRLVSVDVREAQRLATPVAETLEV